MYVHMVVGILGKRKRMTKLVARVATSLQVTEAADPLPREGNVNHDVEDQQGNTNRSSSVNEGKQKVFGVNFKFGL